MMIAQQMYNIMFEESKTFESWYVPMIQKWLDDQQNVDEKSLDGLVRDFNQYMDEQEQALEFMDAP